MKVRVAAPEPPSRPSSGGIWIAFVVVVGTCVGMLGLAYSRAEGTPVIRTTSGGPLLERPAARRDGEPTFVPSEPVAEGPHLEPAGAAPSRAATGPAATGPAATLAEASQRVPIELYSASWCSACATAHRWLDANNVRYEEIDVDRRPGARAQLTALNPRRTLPTFDIDGDVLVGFDPTRLGSAITTAAARHTN